MAILTTSGRAAVAASIKNETLYMAWGNGLAAWDTSPDEPGADDADLEAEIGRRLVAIKQYVVSDPDGDIMFPGDDNYSTSAEPTGKLYLKVTFDFSDASDQIIREVGIFQGTVPSAGYEATPYLTPDHVDDKGILMTLDRISKITRNVNNREIFEIIITI